MITNNETVSAEEFVHDWATEHGLSDSCHAYLAPTIDHKVIVVALGSSGWLELPGTHPDQAISSEERRQIAQWLEDYLLRQSAPSLAQDILLKTTLAAKSGCDMIAPTA